MKDIFFISDVHLYPESEEHPGREKLYKFLMHLSNFENPGELWILGDLFDFWFEYKYLIPCGFDNLLSQLRKLVKDGWEVNILPGNHDFGIADKFADTTGVRIHTNRIIIIKRAESTILLAHGDGLGAGDVGYKLIRPVLRSPISAFLFKLIPANIAFFSARLFSGTSKRILRHKCDCIPNGLDKWVDARLSGNIDIVITGHTHVPLLEEKNNGIFISLGDWLTKWTYCIIDGETGKPELLTFK